ncbi:sulfate transporter family-domain-containing protein [Multifurca ochricompacta]|uniref:Sulfate transporter family-domain-containing protein n=1 Tax=Multifurca ochricompacta TaxID=376703 RepID=A0AAD4M5U5_9AGAM|nr:sulfate transporter family-domain-containing protein [Multifurca ochricompacta]
MSLGTDSHSRRPPHNPSATPSIRDSHPGTPWREDDENAPLLRAGDIERAAYGVSRDPGLDLEADTVKPSAQASSTTWAKAQYYIPSLHWIPNYTLSLFGGDLTAGLTVAAMLIPQSVSYATSLAKMSPVTGLCMLLSLIICSIVFRINTPLAYGLLGSSRQLNVAPEAALSLLVGQTVTSMLRSDPHTPPTNPEAVGLAVATAITVGLISFILGFFRLGFIDVVLSRALLRGFVTAVACIILIEQLIPMLGLTALEHTLKPQTTLEKIFLLIEYGFTRAHRPTAFVSACALVSLVMLRMLKASLRRYKWVARVPEVLIVVIVSTILSDEFHWDDDGIAILGDVPIHTGGQFIKFPLHHHNLPYLRQTTSTAVLISIVGFLDSIVAAKQNAARYSYSISPNRELVALGAANLAGAFVPGTLPAYGSITRSRINGEAGARTQMASLICAAIILIATFFLLPWLYYLPKCVLGSIVCLVVYSLLAETPEDVIFYWKMRAWIDMTLMGLTFILTIIWSVQVGVTVSLIISLLLVVRRSSRTRMTILGRIPGTDRWEPIDESPGAEEDTPGVLIVRIRENLDFANTAQLKERLRRLELYGVHRNHPSDVPRRQQASVFIFHVADVETCDASAVQIFHELFESYRSRGVGVFITHLRPEPRVMFERGGIVKLLGEDAFYEDVGKAMSRLTGR